MHTAAVIFDLDGTLLDTLEDIAASANEVLESLGFARHPADDFKAFIGAGVDVLFERALPVDVAADRAMISEAADRFRVFYAEQWHVNSRPYDGVAALLDGLRQREVLCAVLTNKPHEFAGQCVSRLLPQWHFEIVLGLDESRAAKPDPGGALAIARTLGVAPQRTKFVGDSGIDMQTARAAGMAGVGAAWGFRPENELIENGANWLIRSPEQLLELL